jgi:parvulin-like peptidyl-prolyl isomerase
MRRGLRILIAAVCILSAGLSGGLAVGQDLPVVKGKKIVASVDGDPITLDTLNQEIALAKRTMALGAAFDKKAELDLLKRLISIRLIIQEAKNIGLDKLSDIKQMVDAFSREALRGELAAKVTKDVKADEQEVERLYKASVKEWKVSAVLCEKEEDAKQMEKELQSGRDFSEVAKEFAAAQKAKPGEDGVYLKAKDADSQFEKILSAMAVGSVSPSIQTKSGYVFVRLEDVRIAEDPEEREKVRQELLTNGRKESLKAFDEALKKKSVKIYRDVLASVDYEAPKPSFEALLKDARVVAEIKGEKPITVGEMTEEMKFQFYHGVEAAAERKKLNARKDQVLEGMLHRKLFRKEALRQGLDKTESYKNKVREYETGLLFGAFMNKVIDPEVKLKEDEVKVYYNDHLKEYTTPEMMRIQGLVFAKRGDAENAVEKLKEGAEFQWLSAHAEGQVDKDSKGVLPFEGKLITTADLPEGARKAIAGARTGDVRLYASPEGHFYAMAIQDVVPPKPQPYEEARKSIAEKIFAEKEKKALEEYADKLRSVSDVKVYLKS